jgi:hypothetical protein
MTACVAFHHHMAAEINFHKKIKRGLWKNLPATDDILMETESAADIFSY